jgi:hypothetical protein
MLLNEAQQTAATYFVRKYLFLVTKWVANFRFVSTDGTALLPMNIWCAKFINHKINSAVPHRLGTVTTGLEFFSGLEFYCLIKNMKVMLVGLFLGAFVFGFK